MNAARLSLVPLVVLVAAGAVFALLDALRALPTGNGPGEGPTGEGFFVGVPALALLLGGFGCIYLARNSVSPLLAWLVAPLAGAFTLVHLYFYDDYCGGYACRIADEAPTAWRWCYGLALAGLATGVLTALRPRAGLRASGVVAILCALTVLFIGTGH